MSLRKAIGAGSLTPRSHRLAPGEGANSCALPEGQGGGRLHEIYRNRWVGARAEVVVPEAGPDYEVEHT